jgi:predicted  nucleic acid-binding Zn-ribbon protein
MAEPTKTVKGGFRATLVLIISVVALILSISAFTFSERNEELKARIKDLQTTIEKTKAESAEQLEKLRNETARALEKMSKAVRKEEGLKEATEGSTADAAK